MQDKSTKYSGAQGGEVAQRVSRGRYRVYEDPILRGKYGELAMWVDGEKVIDLSKEYGVKQQNQTRNDDNLVEMVDQHYHAYRATASIGEEM